ncbi:hypothetical protein PsorP6_013794 [Peronosclerospora sorghi]|uniref:Uncharacterized protein n=1 Tax=Peronosclerospora sorghi TaxID=230839 RepID=A0ACC0VFL8_9STRA|nr:hypothetical protein PsorP6_013794 [Peronosclerospora sorghi]
MQKDVTIGGLILLASVATTCVFESALVRSIRSFEEGRSIVITLSKPHVLTSNEGQLILFSGLITTTASDIKSQWNIRNPGAQPVRQSPFVLDPTFGVAVKGVRLHRHVEMLQWVETSHTSMSSTPEDEDRRFDDDRERIFMYNMQWSENIISSIGFDDPSHANPPSEAWKYTSLVVKANDLVVGDFLLPESLVDQIQRKDIVPLDAANRRLMANLLVQRKGAEWDEYSALKNVSVQDNYLYFHDGVPVVGDQRVFFEVTPNYPVTVCAKQNGHDLEPFKSSTGESIFLLQDGMMTSSEFFDKKIRAKNYQLQSFTHYCPSNMEVDSAAGNEVVLTAQSIIEESNARGADMEVENENGVVRPNFPALNAQQQSGFKNDFRRVRVPAHRYSPLKKDWPNVMKPIVEHLKLQIRMNTKTRCIELKNSPQTTDAGALQKAADFVQAYMMGFEVQDAVALLRLEDLFIDTFEINDVKMLKGDHLSRAIGRVAGQDGKTKYAVENATRTRIVLADQKIHILGSFANIKLARDAICSLIMGAPPGKVYNKMRNVASRMNERF